jgi:glycosyltransferase involved in cell wall biosynthesis
VEQGLGRARYLRAAREGEIRILFVVPTWPVVLNKGYQTRTAAFVRYLAARHRVEVWGSLPVDSGGLGTGALRVARATREAALALSQGWPVQCALFEDRTLTAATIRRAREFSPEVTVVVTERLPHTTLALVERYPVVLDVVDALEISFRARAHDHRIRRSIYAREAQGFKRLSAVLAAATDQIVVSSSRERQAYPRALTIYNGAEPLGGERPPAMYDVAFTGTLSYWANVAAVEELCSRLLPRLREAFPGLRVVVAGREPTATVRKLCARSGVTLMANVPSISDILRRSRLAVAPVRQATGSQLKVVEALAAGTPIVAYPAATDGLPDLPVRGLVRCPDEDSFVAAARDILSNPHVPVALPSGLTWESQTERFERYLRQVATTRMAVNSSGPQDNSLE